MVGVRLYNPENIKSVLSVSNPFNPCSIFNHNNMKIIKITLFIAFAFGIVKTNAQSLAANYAFNDDKNAITAFAKSPTLSLKALFNTQTGNAFGIEASGIYFGPSYPSIEQHFVSFNRMHQNDLTKGLSAFEGRGGGNVGFGSNLGIFYLYAGYQFNHAYSEAVFFSGMKREIRLFQEGFNMMIGMGSLNLLKDSENKAFYVGAIVHIVQETGHFHSGTRLPDGTLTYSWNYTYKYNGKYLLPWHVSFGTGIRMRYMVAKKSGFFAHCIYYGLFKGVDAASVAGPIELVGEFDTSGGGPISSVYYTVNKYLPTTIIDPTGRGVGEASATSLQGFAFQLGFAYYF